jgi:hypothetical protein
LKEKCTIEKGKIHPIDLSTQGVLHFYLYPKEIKWLNNHIYREDEDEVS